MGDWDDHSKWARALLKHDTGAWEYMQRVIRKWMRKQPGVRSCEVDELVQGFCAHIWNRRGKFLQPAVEDSDFRMMGYLRGAVENFYRDSKDKAGKEPLSAFDENSPHAPKVSDAGPPRPFVLEQLDEVRARTRWAMEVFRRVFASEGNSSYLASLLLMERARLLLVMSAARDCGTEGVMNLAEELDLIAPWSRRERALGLGPGTLQEAWELVMANPEADGDLDQDTIAGLLGLGGARFRQWLCRGRRRVREALRDDGWCAKYFPHLRRAGGKDGPCAKLFPHWRTTQGGE